MRRIALHEYLGQIEGLLDDNRLPEAAAHCHFVLQQHPRHVGAYRLFGRALLEQQLYEEAIDVFERILSADPEDLISHAGLALAYGESRDLERAIWHMERAFELDPYNRAVQDELRKLYIARDGDAPARLALTRAALARLHFRGALYEQAADEFARLAATNPERIDLRLSLADALYRDSGVAEAADVCRQVLEELPYCIKANAILADALLKEEAVDEARLHLRRVQDLTVLDRAHVDPDTTLGRALGNSRISLPESVQVEVLEDTLAFAKGFEESGAWSRTTTSVVVDGEALPDWLQELGSPDSAAAPSQSLETVEETEAAELVDWLDEVAATVEDETDSSQEVSSDELALDTAETLATAGLAAEMPSAMADEALETALDAVQSQDVDTAAAESVERPSPSVSQEQEPVADGSPMDSRDDVGDALEAAADEAGTPVWGNERLLALDELRSYIDDDSRRSSADASSPAWLDELADSTDVTDELPHWLHEAVGFESPESTGGDLSAPQMLEERAPQSSEAPANDSAAHGELSDGIERRDDESEGDFEPESRDVQGSSAVPEWLLEGDDVLDELPAGLIQGDEARDKVEGSQEADTMTWLDELSEQLASDTGTSQSFPSRDTPAQDDDATKGDE